MGELDWKQSFPAAAARKQPWLAAVQAHSPMLWHDGATLLPEKSELDIYSSGHLQVSAMDFGFQDFS